MRFTASADQYNAGNFQQQEAEKIKIALYEKENIFQIKKSIQRLSHDEGESLIILECQSGTTNHTL